MVESECFTAVSRYSQVFILAVLLLGFSAQLSGQTFSPKKGLSTATLNKPQAKDNPTGWERTYFIADDSAKEKKPFLGCEECGEDGCFGNTKLLAAFDTRWSFNTGDRVAMNGFRLGLDFYKTIRFGAGAYWLDTPIDISFKDGNGTVPDTTQKLNFRYGAIFTEYILYRDFFWEASVPITFGVGEREIRTFASDVEEHVKEDVETVNVITINLDGNFKPVPFVAIGGGIGYRTVISDEQFMKDQFNGPIYILRVKFLLGKFIQFLVNSSKMKEEREEYLKQRAERRARKGKS